MQKRLKKRQQIVIDDLFAGNMDEQEVLNKHNVGRVTFRKWLEEEVFRSEIESRVEAAVRQSSFLLAKYAPLAAAKLIKLTESDKDETVRKTCLDIIGYVRPAEQKAAEGTKHNSGRRSAVPSGGAAVPMSPGSVSKLLSILAEEKPSKRAKA